MTDEKKTEIKTIPTSILIADARNKLNEIAQHPLLPPSILELIFKEAWQSVAFKAQAQLTSDYETYNQEQEKGIGDTENGI